MIEKLRKPAVIFGLSAALGLTACSSGTTSAESQATPAASQDRSVKTGPEYLPDGTRLLNMGGPITTADGYIEYPADVLQYCDAGDLLEQTLGSRNYPAGGLMRTRDYPGCLDDGKLTPSDYEGK